MSYKKTIKSIKKYIKNYRRIIVISKEKLTNIENIEWFDEKQFPFSRRDIFHKDKIKLRKITWLECGAKPKKQNDIINNYESEFEKIKNKALRQNHNFIAFHSYNREQYLK